MTESMFQQILVQQVRILYPDVVINLSMNGVLLPGTPKQKAQIISQMQKEGMLKGAPDLSLYLPEGKTLNLELKRSDGRGTQSDSQKEVAKALRVLDHTYYIIDSFDKAWDAIADNTTEAYRTECLNALVDGSKPKLIEDVLMFSKGTPTVEVISFLKEKYRLN